MPRLEDMKLVATDRLNAYTDPANHYAFRTHDRVPEGHGDTLVPEDILAANLLSLRLSWKEVTPLFAGGTGPAQDLLARLNDALVELRDAPAFEEHDDVSALEDTLTPLATANRATEKVKKWTAVTVSKVLHRHLPHIVPIIDSRVREFYGLPRTNVAGVRAALFEDIRNNEDWLSDLAAAYHRPDGRPMSLVRAADIIIWTPVKP